MTILSDTSKWIREKDQLSLSFEFNAKKINNASAAKGHLFRPGYVFEQLIQSELDYKLKIDDLNFKIVSEAIERELKQSNIAYDIAFKNAKALWELNKQNLLASFDQELADLKLRQSMTEEELVRLSIEVSLRAIILQELKTAIEIERELVKRDIDQTENIPLENEVRLANEKLFTASKKLELIPYIESIIEKEYQLLDAENLIITDMQDLLVIKEQVAEERLTLIPKLLEKASAEQNLSDAILGPNGDGTIDGSIYWTKKKLDYALAKTILQKEQIDGEAILIDADITLNELRRQLFWAGLQLQKYTTEQHYKDTNGTVLRNVLDNIKTSSSLLLSNQNTLERKRAEIYSILNSNRAIIHDWDLKLKKEVEIGLTGSGPSAYTDIEATGLIAEKRSYGQRHAAEKTASAQITSALLHELVG